MKYQVAGDLMRTDIITVPHDASIREVADLFSNSMITGAPVVDENGRPVGVVSVSDIVRHIAAQDERVVATEDNREYFLRGWEEELDESDLEGLHFERMEPLQARHIMTSLLFKVDENTSIQEMADIMISGRIHRLLVTQKDRVVGIVTTLDMLKALRKS